MRRRQRALVGGFLVFLALLVTGGQLARNHGDDLQGYPQLTTAEAQAAAAMLFGVDDQSMVIPSMRTGPATPSTVAPAVVLEMSAASERMRTLQKASGLEYSAATSTADVTALHQRGSTATVTVDRLTTLTLAVPVAGGQPAESLGDTYELTLTWSGTGWVVTSERRTTPCC